MFDNIARFKELTKNHRFTSEVLKQIRQVGLEGFEDRNINDLSGGQNNALQSQEQFVMKPKVLLLDEPLAALDVQLRQQMREELKRLQKKLGLLLMVSHDQEEALSISDRIVVMNEGLINKLEVLSIYNEPENLWVAKFIGQSNIIEYFVEDNKVKSMVKFCLWWYKFWYWWKINWYCYSSWRYWNQKINTGFLMVLLLILT